MNTTVNIYERVVKDEESQESKSLFSQTTHKISGKISRVSPSSRTRTKTRWNKQSFKPEIQAVPLPEDENADGNPLT